MNALTPNAFILASRQVRHARALLAFTLSVAGTSLCLGYGGVPESAPAFIRDPVSATIVQTETAILEASAGGNPAPTYQWFKNGSILRGATASTLVIPNVQFSDAGSYSVTASNKKGNAASRAAFLSVQVAVTPTFTDQPPSTTANAGQFFTLSVTVSGAPTPQLQWRKNGVDIPGATSATLRFSVVQITDAGSYDVVAKNSAGTAISEPAVLTIGIPPTVFVQHPPSAVINWGAIITFDVFATGQNVRYQWKKNGVPIPRAQGHSFTVSSATAADMGFYSVLAIGDGGTVESETAILTVDSASFWSFSTLAGAPSRNGSADGVGSSARFNFPNGLAVDGAGNIYVADRNNHSIRKITPDGVVTTLADGIDTPDGVAVDSAGTIFVADWGSHIINKITPQGTVTVFAGRPGEAGSANGAATEARFNHPAGIALDGSGNLFVAENSNHTIRKISPDGTVSTIAGQAAVTGSADGVGASARFNWPNGIAVNSAGTIYVTDATNSTVRKITLAGEVTTLAGLVGNTGGFTGDATGSNARFNGPSGVAVDNAGNLYVADEHRQTIRRISPSGEATTLAGLGNVAGSTDGTGGDARFNNPYGIAIDSAGNLYVADNSSCTIRKGVLMANTSVPSRLVNLSTRGFVPPNGALTPGFALRGSGSKQLVIRAAGPALASFGVGGALADPKLQVIPSSAMTASLANDNWGTNTNTAALTLASSIVGAFPFLAGSNDAALLATLNTAADTRYTVPVTPTGTTASGLVLAEIYDADPLTTPVRLASVSTLSFVGRGANALVPGFTIGGKEPKRLLIRAVGPGLAQFGFGEVLADPQLTVIPVGQSFTIARNDNWGGGSTLAEAFAQVGAFALAPGSKDAALIVRLPPGGYTVTVSGVGDTTGPALVEIYDLDP